MQNNSSPEKHQNGQRLDRGSRDLTSDWSATLSEINVTAANHKALRNKPNGEKAKDFLSLLADVVEGQVIPRLMLAHKSASGGAEPEGSLIVPPELAVDKAIEAEVIEPFTALLLSGTVEDLEDFVVRITRSGTSATSIYLDLMAPAARLLGQFWEDDKCSFTDVTLGLGRLQTLLYRLSAKQTRSDGIDGGSPKALFMTPEGGQHSLGVRMIEELYRQAGWRTNCEINTPLPTILSLVSVEAFDLVGIGLSSEGQVEQTRDIIEQIRKASLNQNLQVIIGGKLVADDPDLAKQVGADLSARDGKEAIVIANKILYTYQRAD
jgi:MerR family transcriptional regulator, light-induced transcriptional regulator